MSYSWLESLEEYISDLIDHHGLDPREAWAEVEANLEHERG